MKDCPCGLDSTYTDCCGRLIRGSARAETAEDLMRSRNIAFALQEWDYLVDTLCAAERSKKSASDFEKGTGDLTWDKLEVGGTKKGGRDDDEGQVEFSAHYSESGDKFAVHETGHFLKEDGRWVYSEKKSKSHVHGEGDTCGHSHAPKKPVVREGAKVGRNDPCPCNSGKKYKKCCGK